MKNLVYILLIALSTGCITRKAPKLTPIPRTVIQPVLTISYIELTNLVMQVTGGTSYVTYRAESIDVDGTVNMSAYMGTTVQLSWDTIPNKTYTIQQTDDLTSTWTEVKVWFVGDGRTIIWYDFPRDTQFYRLKVK